MAFSLGGFNSGAEGSGGGTIHHYTSGDLLGDMTAANYFEAVKFIVRTGDVILCYSTSQKEYAWLRCSKDTNNTVTVSRMGESSNGDLVISIGSSILAQGFINNSSHFGYESVGPCEWALRQLGHRFRYLNQAVSGQSTTEMLARLNDDVLVHRPKVVIVQNGTNEIGTGIDALEETTLQMYDRILGSGSILVVFGTLTRDAASSWDADDYETAAALNEFKRRYCEAHSKAIFVDTNKYIVDPASTNGEALTGMLRDGTHFTARGAFAAAQPLKDVLEDIFPPHDVLTTYVKNPDGADFTFGNELPNPALAGTGGATGAGGSGDVPDDYEIERTGSHTGTIAATVAAKSALDPRNEVELTLTPSGTAGVEEFYFRTDSATLVPDSIGELYEALLGIDVDAWDGWESIALEIDDQSAVNKTYYDNSNIYDEPMPVHAWDGVLRTPEVEITGNQRYRLRIGIKGDASGTGTLRVHSPIFRAIDPDTRLAIPYETLEA